MYIYIYMLLFHVEKLKFVITTVNIYKVIKSNNK